MDIAYLPRWVWIIAGILLGAFGGYQWSSVSDTMDGVARASQVRFEQDLTMKDQNGNPLIKGIVIHPPEYSPADRGNVNIVSYKRLAQDRAGKHWWIDKCFVAKIPFEPMNGAVASTPNMTVETYLLEMAKQNSGIKFNVGWWMQPKNATLLGSIGGLVLIGGLWPSLINIMIGAGFGPKRERKPSLWSIKNRKAKEKAKPVVTAEQMQQVADITAAYEQNMGAAGISIDTPPPAGSGKAAEPEVRKLQTAGVEEVKPNAQPVSDDEFEVKGEYYPVLIHHHKKKEEEPHKDEHSAGH
jgi:hypothetical protein